MTQLKTYLEHERDFYLQVNNLEDKGEVAELRLLVANTVENHLKAYAQSALDYLETN